MGNKDGNGAHAQEGLLNRRRRAAPQPQAHAASAGPSTRHGLAPAPRNEDERPAGSGRRDRRGGAASGPKLLLLLLQVVYSSGPVVESVVCGGWDYGAGVEHGGEAPGAVEVLGEWLRFAFSCSHWVCGCWEER